MRASESPWPLSPRPSSSAPPAATRVTELKATFCLIHEPFYFDVATMMPRSDWQMNVGTQSRRRRKRRRTRGRNRITIYAVMQKKKSNKTLSSFHSRFWRTGFFWAATLLNLICHSIWFKVCLMPLTLLSFTLAPTSILLGFHPPRIFPFHPSLGPPFIFLPPSLFASTHTCDSETENLLTFSGPECPRWKRKSNSFCFLKLESGNMLSRQSSTCLWSAKCLCPTFPLAACCLQFLTDQQNCTTTPL